MTPTERSLSRQTVLLALAAAAVDTASFMFSGVLDHAGAKATALFAVASAALNIALAAPVRFIGLVWTLQGFLQLGGAYVFHDLSPLPPILPAGYLIAGYLSGAWIVSMKHLVPVAVVNAVIVVAHDAVAGIDRAEWTLAIGVVAVIVIPILLGRLTTARQAYLAELEHRLKQRRLVELAAFDTMIAEERSAIARDLHDVIAHHVSAVGIHAGAARLGLTAPSLATTRTSLEAIESSSRAAMADLRRQLDLLHGHNSDGRRQPGLANIDYLLDTVRSAGMSVEFVTHGMLPELAESLDVAIYRIVQELLTNALKHGSGQAHLHLTGTETDITITQHNPYRDPTGGRLNHVEATRRGLIGVRRRAELFDGSVTIDTDDRWTIVVNLPVQVDDA